MNARPPRRPSAPRTGSAPPAAPLDDAAIARLQDLLGALPAPLEPLDLSALDGYLCGVLLQPQPVPWARWWPRVVDVDGRAVPAGLALDELQALVQRRHAELAAAIAARRWFDPWIAEPVPDASPTDAVLPWVAGFAMAIEAFPALMAIDDPALIEPLALLYLHFDADDLEEADALLEAIAEIEPPADLAEAAEDLVSAVLLIADVTAPRGAADGAPAARRAPARRPGRE